MKPRTKAEAEQRIKEILAKHPAFKGAKITIRFKEKKREYNNDPDAPQ